MKTATLHRVAPAQPAQLSFQPDDIIWQLSLEQIEPYTGRILTKVVGPASTTGSSTHAFDEGNVLYSKLRPYLNKVVCPESPGIATTELVPLRPDPKRLDRRYLTHYLRSPQFVRWASNAVAGAKMPRVAMKVFWSYSIPLPPLAEQKRIAAILDAADTLRAKRRETLAQLDTLLQSTFLDMFGDPVTNPKGWEHYCFNDLLDLVQYGPRFYNEAYTDNGVKIVRITDLDFEGNLDFGSMPTLKVSEDDQNKFILCPGDLILARTGATVGKTAIIRAGDPKCIAGAYFIRMQFHKKVSPVYAQWVMKSAGVQAIIWQRSQQSAQPNFNGPAIRMLPLPLPSVYLQRRFVAIVESVERQKVRMRAHLAELDALFASLQSRAFNGEL